MIGVWETILGVGLGVVALLAWALRRRHPDVRTCETCRSWDWAAGQTAMSAHTPFAAVMRELQPWQVGATHRAFEPNPDYETLRARLVAAVDASDDELAAALQAELDAMNPKRLALESTLPPADFGGVSWEDFGACMQHREGRVRQDTCASWTRATTEQATRNRRRLPVVGGAT